MATLTNTKIKDTYVGLLKTTDNQAIDASGVTLVEDGAGNASALSVGRSGNGVSISGNLAVDTNTLYVESTNNRVGIGTSSLGAKLDISNSTSDPTLRLKNTNNTSYTTSQVYNDSDKGLDTLVYGSAYAGGSVLSVGANGLAMFSNTTTALTTLGAFDMRFGTNGSERMRIHSNGRVTIGDDTTIATANNLNLTNASSAELDLNCTGGKNFRLISDTSDAFIIKD